MVVINFLKVTSVLASIVGGTYLIPIIVALCYGESTVLMPFIIPMVISILVMLAVNIPTRKIKYQMSIRQTYFIVAMSWVVVSLMGALPLYFSGCYNTFIDSLFESVSGFSTTGATVYSEIDELPRSINMWRCLTHWLGGMGIVTLTVALLPLLGVGGFQLIKAETSGPEKGKVTSKITTTAKLLWLIYAGLTVIEAIALKIAGMDVVDSISHAFATLGTGGFSTKAASVGHYDSVAIDVIITVFMFLSGINFSLYFYLITGKFKEIYQNSEFKAYLSILLIAIVGVTISVLPMYGSFGKSLRYSSFQAVSIMTTTGFATTDFLNWPAAAQFFLFILYFTGGCSGSTSGGFKVIRWVVLGKQINNETKRMIHPHGIFNIRINGSVGRKDIVFNVTAFLALYLLLIAITTFVGCIGHLDLWSAFTGALSMVGSVGPGFGTLGPSANYGFLPAFVKLWYSFAMLAGRLELYTMMIFIMPAYWKK